MDYPDFIVFKFVEKYIGLQRYKSVCCLVRTLKSHFVTFRYFNVICPVQICNYKSVSRIDIFVYANLNPMYPVILSMCYYLLSRSEN